MSLTAVTSEKKNVRGSLTMGDAESEFEFPEMRVLVQSRSMSIPLSGGSRNFHLGLLLTRDTVTGLHIYNKIK